MDVAPILTFAKLTIWEASRRKLLIALVLLTLAIIVGTSFLMSRLWTVGGQNGRPLSEVEVRLIASQLLILIAFMFSAVLALSSVMVAAPSISADVESGLVLSMLSRPVRRADQRRPEALALLGQGSQRLPGQQGSGRVAVAKISQPVADLGGHPQSVAHDRASSPRPVRTGTSVARPRAPHSPPCPPRPPGTSPTRRTENKSPARHPAGHPRTPNPRTAVAGRPRRGD